MPLPPGPKAPPAVQLARWLTRPVAQLEECGRRWGDAFTLRLPTAGSVVMIANPAAIKALWAQDRTSGVPQSRNVTLGPLVGPRSLLVIEGEAHLRRRRLMLPPFHGERMRAYEGIVREAALADMERWPPGRPFALHPRMQAITLQVITRAVFGLSEGDRAERLRAQLVEILRLALTAGGQVAAVLPRLGRLPGLGRFHATVSAIDELLAAEVAERREAPDLDEREDILSMLVQATDEEGRPLTDGDLRDQLMTLLVAGHETTATALSWTFDALFHHPRISERLVAEIDAGSDEELLSAVVQESLRLRPVVPVAGRRLGEPLVVDGLELEPGTFVTPCIYLTHRRPDLYPEPRAFRPERFLTGDAPDTFSWIPFGGGMRRCIGAAFATFEMKIVLRTVLERAELRAASSRPERPLRRTVTLAPRNGTRAVLVRRRVGVQGSVPPAVQGATA